MPFEINESISYTYISIACIIGFTYGLYNWFSVSSIELKSESEGKDGITVLEEAQLNELKQNSKKISDGAITFLTSEYFYITFFLIFFSIIIAWIDKFKYFTMIAFLLGAITSLLSGFIGMYVATSANSRVTYTAARFSDIDISYKKAFCVAFNGGCVMGFCLVSLALFVLLGIIYAYKEILKPQKLEEWLLMFEYIAGYGLGGSAVALFCRVGGGIFTKAADVGADLVGKYELGLNEDSNENPATIADNVGDNVGDIAGMGSDLFGSFAESTVAALVISGDSPDLIKNGYYFYPLLISATGILICLLTTLFITCFSIESSDDGKNSRSGSIESILKWQIIISTIFLTPAIVILSKIGLPQSITFIISKDIIFITNSQHIMICCILGLWSGLIIGYFTDYWTSNSHDPVIELSHSCKRGAAINIINGLALGYYSCVIPVICITGTIYFSFQYAGMYGIAISALGMLANLCICLAIDAYGPISDNAGGLAEMCGFIPEIRKKTDELDAAGNTTAAIGKGFAIGSACLVSLALFGAFVTRTNISEVDILEPIEMTSLVVGAMIPYAFSALTMKSVGIAAGEMCETVRQQIAEKRKDPNIDQKADSQKCIEIATKSSLREMILPGIIVIFTPLLLGGLFGPKAVAGYLAGVIVSGVQMAISSSNTGGAWDNAKKYIESGKLQNTEIIVYSNNENSINTQKLYYDKSSKPYKSAVIGDTVGDPLKDTSGPSINILIKLSAIVSLVFGSFFQNSFVFKGKMRMQSFA